MPKVLALLFLLICVADQAWAKPFNVYQDEEGGLLVLKAYRDFAQKRYGVDVDFGALDQNVGISDNLKGKLLAESIAKAGFSLDETILLMTGPDYRSYRLGILGETDYLGQGPNKNIFGQLFSGLMKYLYTGFDADACAGDECWAELEKKRLKHAKSLGISESTLDRLSFFLHHRSILDDADRLVLESLEESEDSEEKFKTAMRIYKLGEDYGFNDLVGVRRVLLMHKGIGEASDRETAVLKATLLLNDNNFGAPDFPNYPVESSICQYLANRQRVIPVPPGLMALMMMQAIENDDDERLAKLVSVSGDYIRNKKNLDPATIKLRGTWLLLQPGSFHYFPPKDELILSLKQAEETMKDYSWVLKLKKQNIYGRGLENLAFYCLFSNIPDEADKIAEKLIDKGTGWTSAYYDLLKPGAAFIGETTTRRGQKVNNYYFYIEEVNLNSKIISGRFNQDGKLIKSYPKGLRFSSKTIGFPHSEYPLFIPLMMTKDGWEIKLKLNKGHLEGYSSSEQSRKDRQSWRVKLRPSTVKELKSKGFKLN